jgi:hypothetical protein
MSTDPWRPFADALAHEVSALLAVGAIRDPVTFAGPLLAWTSDPSQDAADALARAVEAAAAEGRVTSGKALVRALFDYAAERTRPARDWREAAQGIPVTEGDRTCTADGFGGEIVIRVDGDNVLLSCGKGTPTWERQGEHLRDLSDPRTQRAYLGDLALALGAPAEAVEEGVVFICRGRGQWTLAAGCALPEWDPRWMHQIDRGSDDRLTALAEAWPADKRVGR